MKCGLDKVGLPLDWQAAADTAELARSDGRQYLNRHFRGPIATWEEFERYPWPDPAAIGDSKLRWYEKNLPEDMCIVAHSGFGHPMEFLAGLMGYETLCYALFEPGQLGGGDQSRPSSWTCTLPSCDGSSNTTA